MSSLWRQGPWFFPPGTAYPDLPNLTLPFLTHFPSSLLLWTAFFSSPLSTFSPPLIFSSWYSPSVRFLVGPTRGTLIASLLKIVSGGPRLLANPRPSPLLSLVAPCQIFLGSSLETASQPDSNHFPPPSKFVDVSDPSVN